MNTAHTIRPAREQDWQSILDILNHYIEHEHHTFDDRCFSLQERVSWFKQFSSEGPYQLLVAENQDQILGYVHSSQFRSKPGYNSSVETTIYLHPEATGIGVGLSLYQQLLSNLSTLALHRAYAGIALPNPASEALHRKLGFFEIGVFREVGIKFGRYYDVKWLGCELPIQT